MITAYTGVPGGGKSLHAAQEILDAITKKGVPVIANFDVNRPKFSKVRFRRKVMGEFYHLPNGVLKPDVLVGFAKAHYRSHDFSEGGILLVIDEAQLLFNARTWNDGLVTSQDDTAPKLGVLDVELAERLVTSQDDTAPKPSLVRTITSSGLVTSQDDTAPKLAIKCIEQPMKFGYQPG